MHIASRRKKQPTSNTLTKYESKQEIYLGHRLLSDIIHTKISFPIPVIFITSYKLSFTNIGYPSLKTHSLSLEIHSLSLTTPATQVRLRRSFLNQASIMPLFQPDIATQTQIFLFLKEWQIYQFAKLILERMVNILSMLKVLACIFLPTLAICQEHTFVVATTSWGQ